MRFYNAWIPPFIPIKAWVCARVDCSEKRELGRRWCQKHADLWDALMRCREEIPEVLVLPAEGDEE